MLSYIEAVKQVVVRLLVLHEQLQVLEHLGEAEPPSIQTQYWRHRELGGGAAYCDTYSLLHGHFVVVADGVFSQEVELHHVLLAVFFRVQLDVLHSERAAAHCVCRLAFLLLVARS